MSDDLSTFRHETRDWLEANCPASMRTPINSDADMCWGGKNYTFQSDDQKAWFDAMTVKGWTAPTWPRAYGGGGLSPAEAKILREEMDTLGARDALTSFGISMLGPALLKFGTEEQKLEYLPPIVRGEVRWCQGYSEPGAGSDLASLGTRAEIDGDDFILNGQKVWTSYADQADWIFCLVRTNKDAKKQEGISFVLCDMETKGVSTRPIKLISGKSPFCETFFDNVRVPRANLVGDLNRGWDVAKYLLGHEREMIAGMGLVADGSVGAAHADLLASDPILRAQIASFDIEAAAFKACTEVFFEEFKSGKAHPASPSMMKYYGTELNKKRHELTMAAGGLPALEWESEGSDGGADARSWLRTKANSIEGGTSEIQLNIIAKHILRL
ncbi:MAG: acyl-CoA dehydrogenase family protein, partial [Pseudomonadota bacterium]